MTTMWGIHNDTLTDDLVLEHYATLEQTWRTRIPLTQLLVVDDAADA